MCKERLVNIQRLIDILCDLFKELVNILNKVAEFLRNYFDSKIERKIYPHICPQIHIFENSIQKVNSKGYPSHIRLCVRNNC